MGRAEPEETLESLRERVAQLEREREAILARERRTARERDTILERLGDVAPLFLIEVDVDGSVRWLNRFFREQTGWDLDAARGRNAAELVPEDEREAHHEAFRSALHDGSVTHVGTLLGVDGRRFRVEWKRTSVRTEGERARSVLIVGQKVDEAAGLREQLAARDAVLGEFAAMMQEVFWVLEIQRDGGFRFLYLSPAHSRYSKVPHEVFYEDGARSFELIHPDDAHLMREALEGAVSGELEGRQVREYRMFRADGSTAWVQSSFVVMPRGDTIRVLGLTLDLSERRAMEQALRESRDQLEERVRARTAALEEANAALREEARERAAAEALAAKQRERFRSQLDQLFPFVAVLSLDGEVEFINQVGLRASGATLQDVVGRRLWEQPWHASSPETAAALRDAFERVAAGESVRMDMERWTPEGSIWVDVAFTPLRVDGVIEGVLGCAVDITARRAAEESARRSMHEQGVLLREVHHRVKNNLQVVSSLLSLQAARLEEGSVARRRLEETRQRVRAIATLHETLHGARELGRVDLDRYLPRVLEELQRLAQRRDVATFELDLEPISVELDAAVPLGLIVTELSMNALEHAFPEGGAGHVAVRLRRLAGPRLELEVSDDGVGLAEAAQPGAGGRLGLRLVERLVGQLGGELEIDRAAPGTSFVVRCPLGEAGDAASDG